jgi:hypothetical protein
VLRPLRDRLHDLEDALGDDHDVTTLLDTVRTLPDVDSETLQAVARRADAVQAELRSGAFRVAERVYAEKPKVFRRRIGRYLAIWYDDGPELPVGPIEDVLTTREPHEHEPLRVPAGVGY